MKPIENWADAYEPSEFAAKHGLTLDQAKAVISSNGPPGTAATWAPGRF
jgi:hypothetical protein